MIECLAVGAGGFLGAVCRYLIGLIPVKEWMVFPIKTFLINLAGCFAIGIIAALASKHSLLPRGIVYASFKPPRASQSSSDSRALSMV